MPLRPRLQILEPRYQEWTVTSGDEPWSSTYDVTTTDDTSTVIEWSFNPVAALTQGTLSFDNGVDPVQIFDISGDFRFAGLLYAGTVASIDLLNGNRNVFKYDVLLQSVSEVRVSAVFFSSSTGLVWLYWPSQKKCALVWKV